MHTKALSVVGAFTLTGCLQVLGLQSYKDGAGGSGASATSTGTETSSGSAPSGTGGQSPCEPGTISACYDGPPATAKVGDCKAGTHTCLQDHESFTECNDEVVPATEDCTKKGDEDCDGHACSESVWVQTFGDPATQTVTAIATDPAGNVYVGGDFSGVMSIAGSTLQDNGNGDLFIAKLAPDGTHLWAKAFGSTDVDDLTAIAATASGFVILGGSQNHQAVDFGGGPKGPEFVASFTGGGTLSWSRALGTGSYDPPLPGLGTRPAGSLALDSAGNILVAATIKGTIDCGGGNLSGSTNKQDIVVAKLGSAGQHIWSHRYFGTGDSTVSGVAVDFANDVVFTGSISSPTDFQGSILAASDTDAVIFKLKGDGASVLWKQALGGVGSSYTNAIAVDSLGGPIIVGGFGGTMTVGPGVDLSASAGRLFVAKYGASGVYAWSQQLDAAAVFNGIESVTADTHNNVIVTGDTNSSVSFGPTTLNPGAFLAKYDAGGNALWARLLVSGATSAIPYAVAHNATDQLLVGGGFDGASVDFGLGATAGLGGSDASVVEVDR